MEMNRDALLRVVKATRNSMKIAETMQKLMVGSAWSLADEVAGQLQDALFLISGDKLDEGKDFKNSQTMLLLNGDMDDESVTDFMIMTNKIRTRFPAPQIMEKDAVQKLYKQNGGYCYTPEGEFNDGK